MRLDPVDQLQVDARTAVFAQRRAAWTGLSRADVERSWRTSQSDAPGGSQGCACCNGRHARPGVLGDVFPDAPRRGSGDRPIFHAPPAPVAKWDAHAHLTAPAEFGGLPATSLLDYGAPADEEQVWAIWKGNARVKR